MTLTDTDMVVMHPTWTPHLNKALSQLQGELPRIPKGKQGKVEGQNQAGRPYSYTYSYADLADVTDAVGPLLAKYGLAFHAAPTINPADRREMILIWSLLHESGEERSGEWPLGPVNQKPQTLGSAVTYGRRYCLGAVTGIVPDDDDDGQRAQQDHGTTPPARQSAGDAFDDAAPPPPPQDSDTQSWADLAIERASAFKTEAEGQKLWRESAAAARDGRATPGEATHIQNLITARITDRRKDAATRILKPVPENDPWRLKITEELSSDEEARDAREELGRLKAAGTLDETRAGILDRAVLALFPKAALDA